MLTAVEIAERGAKGKHLKWRCVCECGNETIVDAGDLLKGSIVSCGCKAMSKGEIAVCDCLKEYNIDFVSEYILYDLQTSHGGNPRMDFALFNGFKDPVAFIEFQGIQHYVDLGFFGEMAREETDQMKKNYCAKINVPLYEIRYDDIIPETVHNILVDLMLIPCQDSDKE